MNSHPTIDAAITDGQLLAQFVSSGEQLPFELLVRRHATLVLSVCRGVLGGAGASHDAEDAAQATFLTLARKAGSLAGYDSIAGWLHKVAWHIAKRTRAAREIRTRRERAAAQEHGARIERAAEPEAPPPLAEILHAELHRLPEKYRIPLILHHLEGWTEPEIAQLLDSRIGTISGRLSRGRKMLRDRIVRRGGTHLATVTAIGLGAAMSAHASANSPGAALTHQLGASSATVASGAGGAAQAALISPKAVALAEAALKIFRRQHYLALWGWAGFGTTVIVICAALVLKYLHMPEMYWGEIVVPIVQSEVPSTRPVEPPADSLVTRRVRMLPAATRPAITTRGDITGKVVDEQGNPIANARVRLWIDRDAPDVSERPLAGVNTASDGSFVFTQVPAGGELFITIVARQPGMTLGTVEPRGIRVVAGVLNDAGEVQVRRRT